MTRRPGAYGVAVRDRRVLLVWDVEDQQWYFPGGGIEAGESPEQALAREVTEETGFRLTACTPLVYGEQPTPDLIRAQHFFLVDVDESDAGPAEYRSEWVPLVDAQALLEPASGTALTMATPSLVTATVDDLHDPVLPAAGADHRQAVADAGCFAVVEVGGAPTEPRPGPLRVLAANLERGNQLDAWVDLFQQAEADVILASEADGGMARSGNRYVARELADRLGMQFAFAVEFVELGLGGPEERDALPPDARNEFGVHGGAILSRVGLERPTAVRLELDGDVWYHADSDEPRVGGRIALVATVGDLVVVAPHLESHRGPSQRARQLADLLDLVDDHAAGRPVVVGGDLNTHTMDFSGQEDVGDDFPDDRFVDPIRWEPLFAEAERRGYAWADANPPGVTHHQGAKLDWFLTRGVRVSDPTLIPAPMSDHDVIAVTAASRSPA